MVHQMVTLEQYLSIAHVFKQDNPDFSLEDKPDAEYQETFSGKTKQTRLMESQSIISNRIKSYVGVTPQK